MRADPNQNKFADWLLKVGNGLKDLGDDLVKMPKQCFLLVDFHIFPNYSGMFAFFK